MKMCEIEGCQNRAGEMKGTFCPYVPVFCQESSGCHNCNLYLKLFTKEDEVTDYPKDWKILSASCNAILPSRWSILWNCIIRRKPLGYTLEAWVHSPDKIGDVKLWVRWKNL